MLARTSRLVLALLLLVGCQGVPPLEQRAEAELDRGLSLKYDDRFAEAEPVLLEALALYEQSLDPPLDRVVLAHLTLGGVQRRIGKLAAAEGTLVRAVRLADSLPATEHGLRGGAALNLGNVLLGLGRLDEGEASYAAALRHFRAESGGQGRMVALALLWSGLLEVERGAYGRAGRLIEASLETIAADPGSDPGLASRYAYYLACVHRLAGEPARARELEERFGPLRVDQAMIARCQ